MSISSQRFKRFVRELVPPALIRAIRGRSNFIRFEGEFKSWPEIMRKITSLKTDYSAPEILEKVKSAAVEVKEGRAVFERDGICFYKPEYRWPLVASLFLVASGNKNKLHVLDFGGSLGSCFHQHKKLFESFHDLRWSVVEQEHFVELGAAEFSSNQLKFYQTIEEANLAKRVDICVFNSVLQYLPDPFAFLDKLAALEIEYVFLDLTPFIEAKDDVFVVQHVPKSIYLASYPARLFSYETFKNRIMQAWHIESDFESEAAPYWNVSLVQYRGMLLKRKLSRMQNA